MDFDETRKCVRDSFSHSDWGSNQTTNYIIDEEIAYWKTYGSGIYPAIVINNRTFRGQIEQLSVFNALCAGFENAPSICAATLASNTPDFLDEGGIKGSVIVLIVFGLILLNVIIVYCYRRHSKREMQQNMQV
jgi:hypothetical protein